MSWVKKLATAFVLIVALMLPASRALAAAAPGPAVPAGLSIAELKITGNEFVLLQNNTGATIADLSQYWLSVYNNVNPLSSGVSNSTQQLPAASLDVNQTLLLSANGGATCGAAVTGKLSLSFTDSGGFLEVVQNNLNSNGAVVQTAGDDVSWSSGTGAGIIQAVSSKDANAMYYRTGITAGNPNGWQLADFNPESCELDVTVASNPPQPVGNPGNQLLPGSVPPVPIISAAAATPSGPSLPASDAGLMAPVLNELLPNPASPQTDANDEFIELYNPNPTSFDLSGFSLQAGATGSNSDHTYTFPAGTNLPAQSFVAFYSSQTSLSLSSSGQVWLLDPFGNTISQSDPYGTAKDGQVWALANGNWSWSTTPTPNAANIVSAPAGSSKTSATSLPKNVAGTASASTGSSAGTANLTPANSVDTAAQTTPIHPAVLALIAGLALVYGLYEYRSDVANRVYQFRRYRETRRSTRDKP